MNRTVVLAYEPNRPSAITCCRFSSLKTLLTARERIPLLAIQCPDLLPLAGFQVSLMSCVS
jgi:hypothetical protein